MILKTVKNYFIVVTYYVSYSVMSMAKITHYVIEQLAKYKYKLILTIQFANALAFV